MSGLRYEGRHLGVDGEDHRDPGDGAATGQRGGPPRRPSPLLRDMLAEHGIESPVAEG